MKDNTGAVQPKKKMKVPHSFVIILSIVLVMSLLTWVIPAGKFARTENEQGIEVVFPISFLTLRKPLSIL